MAYDCWYQMKIEELLDNMEIWTTNEEAKILKKLSDSHSVDEIVVQNIRDKL